MHINELVGLHERMPSKSVTFGACETLGSSRYELRNLSQKLLSICCTPIAWDNPQKLRRERTFGTSGGGRGENKKKPPNM